MKKTEVLALLKSNQNQRGIENWESLGADRGGLKSFGVGLTQLRKLAKQIGKDHDLALTLWKSKVYDAKVIALSDRRPESNDAAAGRGTGRRSRGRPALARVLILRVRHWLKHHSSSNSRTIGWPARTPCAAAADTGYYTRSPSGRRPNAPDDAYFLGRIKHIRTAFDGEERLIQTAMGGALMGIGKRNKKLNAAALKLARAIGPIQFDDDGKCEPFEVVKHLTSDYIKEKLGV